MDSIKHNKSSEIIIPTAATKITMTVKIVNTLQPYFNAMPFMPIIIISIMSLTSFFQYSINCSLVTASYVE